MLPAAPLVLLYPALQQQQQQQTVDGQLLNLAPVPVVQQTAVAAQGSAPAGQQHVLHLLRPGEAHTQ